MLKIENCKERQWRLLREMEAKGVGLAVLGNPKTVYYFSGALVDPSKPQIFALSASGKSLLVTNQEPSQAAAERVAVYTAYTIERIFNHATMSAEAAELARNFSVGEPGPVGLDYEFTSLVLTQAVEIGRAHV
jgi:hypothetical protein